MFYGDQVLNYGPCTPQLSPNAVGTLPSLMFILGCARVQPAQRLVARRPHVVFMLVDDLGWNDVSFHGSKQIPTPNVDALARDGIILNQYYVQPICSPSRATLLTGKYPIKTGFQHEVILANSPWGLPLTETILPQYLKKLDYATYAVGKWHLGYFKKEYIPRERGFDTFFGYYNGLEDYFTHFSKWEEMEGLDLHDNGENVWKYNGTYGTDLFTAQARKVILEHDPSKPLFLYFAQQSPHSGNFDNPLQAPEKYTKPMVGIPDEKRKIFAGMVSSMDNSVGEIIEALELSGMLDDTIFIFSTDNGGAPEDAQGTRGSNWPLKGCKYTVWEGGVRGVSFIWSPFLRTRSRIHNDLMHISDWIPTILSAVGGPEALKMLPDDLDGVDQWPSIAYRFPSPRSEILLNLDDIEKVAGIRRGRFKLVKGSTHDGKYDKYYDQEGRAFNIKNPCQTSLQKELYKQNYMRFLSQSKAAGILWSKYGKNPRFAISCFSSECRRNLEVQCGVPPREPTCDNKNGFCLFDVVNDPCEFYNVAELYPKVTSRLQKAIEQYSSIAVSPAGVPGDPAGDPKLHGNAWVPWQ